MWFGRKKKRGWNALSGKQKGGIGGLMSVQFLMLAYAITDWFRRPAAGIRGPKLLWLPAMFVNFIGPIAYLKFGRKEADTPRAKQMARPLGEDATAAAAY